MGFIERGHETNYHLNQQRVSLSEYCASARARHSVTVNFQRTDTEEKVSAINLLVFIVFTDITLDVTKDE